MRSPLEQIGRAAGWVAAPAFAVAASLRRARVFHPVGELFEGTIQGGAPPEDLEPLAVALQGRALVRFSSALWKRRIPHVPDVLGCAIRIHDATPGDQDLLFATIRRPWTTGLAPLTTNTSDYLANHYFGVSPFVLLGVPRRFYLRLRPLGHDGAVGSRRDRLLLALEQHTLRLAIDASYRPRGPWREVATLNVERHAAVDRAGLAFDPFRNARGIRPRGAIHALRRGPYAASQAARRAIRKLARVVSVSRG